MISRNLLGHRGIAEHVVESSYGAYDGLSIKRVAVNILDNNAIGYINVIESRAVNILTEDTDDSFTCKVFPTRVPDQGEQVVVLVVSQNDKDGNPYLTLERDEAEPTSEDAVSLKFTPDTDFATVRVKHNSALSVINEIPDAEYAEKTLRQRSSEIESSGRKPSHSSQ